MAGQKELPDSIRAVLQVAGTEYDLVLPFRRFRTGSVGYHGQGKVAVPGTDERLQVNLLATVIGSRVTE